MTTTLWEIAGTVLVINLFVYNEVFADDEDATRADIAGYLEQGVGCLVDWENILADDVIEAKVHLIQSKGLLEIAGVDSTEVLVEITIVDLKASELRILDSNIDTDHCQSDNVRLECLKRTRNGQLVV